MLISLTSLVPEIRLDEEPLSLIVQFYKTAIPPGYREATPGLVELTEHMATVGGNPVWEVKTRPPLLNEDARLERWEFNDLVLGVNGKVATETFAVEIRSPCRHPILTFFWGDNPLITLRPRDPFDAWDGRKLLPSNVTVYDRLQDEVLLGDGLSF